MRLVLLDFFAEGQLAEHQLFWKLRGGMISRHIAKNTILEEPVDHILASLRFSPLLGLSPLDRQAGN